MKEYTYYFADGTSSTVEVEIELYDVLKEMDDRERKQKYNYDRHNVSASLFNYEGSAFIDERTDPFNKLVQDELKERLNTALSALTACQLELFEMVLVERRKVIDIAKEQGVSQQAITDRMCRIKKKLQKLLA
ncbi:MAG: RNA polymerase sigma factor [Christensenellales bacterium]